MIRILCADISCADESDYGKLYEKASAERKRRADRYLRREDKLRCVTAEALLKTALGTDRFQIRKNGFGKPYIENREGFYFNLSHSGEYVVIAWGDSEVGVDIQQHRADTDIRMIAEQYFAPEEREYVFKSDLLQLQRFYEIWTGKESYLKYIGKGLCGDMRSFNILTQNPRVRCVGCVPRGGYSLSLCAKDTNDTFELLDVRQLL